MIYLTYTIIDAFYESESNEGSLRFIEPGYLYWILQSCYSFYGPPQALIMLAIYCPLLRELPSLKSNHRFFPWRTSRLLKSEISSLNLQSCKLSFIFCESFLAPKLVYLPVKKA